MPHPLSSFIEQLARYGPLSTGNRKSILELPTVVERIDRQTHLAREGDVGGSLLVLTGGFALRQKGSNDGGDQISALNLQGDPLNLPSMYLAAYDSDVVALAGAEVASVPKSDFLSLAEDSRAVAYAILRMSLVDACIGREWLLNVACRDARSRIAYFLCSHAERMGERGLVSDGAFDVPLTQEQLGAVTGLTSVHVNRKLKSLETEGLIARKGRSVRILNIEGLMTAGSFKPSRLR